VGLSGRQYSSQLPTGCLIPQYSAQAMARGSHATNLPRSKIAEECLILIVFAGRTGVIIRLTSVRARCSLRRTHRCYFRSILPAPTQQC
jgi:hypothetical protein